MSTRRFNRDAKSVENNNSNGRANSSRFDLTATNLFDSEFKGRHIRPTMTAGIKDDADISRPTAYSDSHETN